MISRPNRHKWHDRHSSARHSAKEQEQAATLQPYSGCLPVDPSERILRVIHPSRVVSIPRYIASLGLYGVWRSRNTTVLTDRRIIVGKGLLSRFEESFPLSRISTASYMRHGPASYTYVNLNQPNQVMRIGPMTPSQGRSVTAEILSRLK